MEMPLIELAALANASATVVYNFCSIFHTCYTPIQLYYAKKRRCWFAIGPASKTIHVFNLGHSTFALASRGCSNVQQETDHFAKSVNFFMLKISIMIRMISMMRTSANGYKSRKLLVSTILAGNIIPSVFAAILSIRWRQPNSWVEG